MSKFKIKVNYPRVAINSRIVRQVNELLGEDGLSIEVGEIVQERIRFSARRGKPLNDSGSFKPLAPSTVENRQDLSGYNSTIDVYSPARSNLSFTGQLLNSIRYRKAKAQGFLIEILFSGDRNPYKTGPNSTAKLTDANRTNQALAKTLDDIGFTVFSKKGIEGNKELIRRIVNTVRSYIRKNLR
jgi:hypothetical protein